MSCYTTSALSFYGSSNFKQITVNLQCRTEAWHAFSTTTDFLVLIYFLIFSVVFGSVWKIKLSDNSSRSIG